MFSYLLFNNFQAENLIPSNYTPSNSVITKNSNSPLLPPGWGIVNGQLKYGIQSTALVGEFDENETPNIYSASGQNTDYDGATKSFNDIFNEINI